MKRAAGLHTRLVNAPKPSVLECYRQSGGSDHARGGFVPGQNLSASTALVKRGPKPCPSEPKKPLSASFPWSIYQVP
jgi:hypothetical protein